jgi:hypothetical protein
MGLTYIIYLIIVVILIIVLLKFLFGVLFVAPLYNHEDVATVNQLIGIRI